MSSQSNFTEQLIALRDHYQAQLAGYELKASQAREQLSHINALLVDQLVTNEDFEEASFSALIPSPDLRAITSAEGHGLKEGASIFHQLSVARISIELH